MLFLGQARATLKRFVFGSTNLHQQCPIGLRDPQSEVTVWLRGLGMPRDVTSTHVMAAAQPFTLGIGLADKQDAAELRRSRVSLEFRERSSEARLLGQLGLRWTETIPVGGSQLYLFETRSCRNYCLPRAQLWTRYVHHAYQNWRAQRRSSPSKIRITARELHSVFVFYICPRPVVLVSVRDGNVANIFPMDLIGPIGARHFSLALHHASAALPLMERSRRIALSSVPVEQISLAYELGKNHRKPCVDWARVPFTTVPSPTLGLPVPRFSLRVREMEIEAVRTLGSHTLFLARTVEDQHWAEGLQLFFVHGIYLVRRRTSQADSAGWIPGSCSHRVA